MCVPVDHVVQLGQICVGESRLVLLQGGGSIALALLLRWADRGRLCGRAGGCRLESAHTSRKHTHQVHSHTPTYTTPPHTHTESPPHLVLWGRGRALSVRRLALAVIAADRRASGGGRHARHGADLGNLVRFRRPWPGEESLPAPGQGRRTCGRLRGKAPPEGQRGLQRTLQNLTQTGRNT